MKLHYAEDHDFATTSLDDLKDAIVAEYPGTSFDAATTAKDFDWDQRARGCSNPLTEEEITRALNDDKYVRDRSAGLASFYELARQRGHSPSEIVAMLLDHPDTVLGGKVEEKSEDWLREDMERWW